MLDGVAHGSHAHHPLRLGLVEEQCSVHRPTQHESLVRSPAHGRDGQAPRRGRVRVGVGVSVRVGIGVAVDDMDGRVVGRVARHGLEAADDAARGKVDDVDGAIEGAEREVAAVAVEGAAARALVGELVPVQLVREALERVEELDVHGASWGELCLSRRQGRLCRQGRPVV